MIAGWGDPPKPKPLPPDTGSIGAVVAKDDDGLLVINVFTDGPAEKAGLQQDDKILAIDGKSLKELKHPARVELLRGKAGTEVTLQVSRSAPKTEIKITVQRVALKDLAGDYLKQMQ